jgi:hypothetical protein
MKTLSLGLAVAMSMTISVGCRDSGGPDQYARLQVTKLEAPATVAAGASVDVVLTVGFGSCITFDRISEGRDGAQINLVVWGRQHIPPGNGSCPDILLTEPRAYRLEPPFPPRFTVVIPPVFGERLLTQDIEVQ